MEGRISEGRGGGVIHVFFIAQACIFLGEIFVLLTGTFITF